jgi:MbtH protein
VPPWTAPAPEPPIVEHPGKQDPVSDTAVDSTYHVVVNHEEQYSIWEAHRRPPEGWRTAGFTGTRQQCLDRIAAVWTDLRPLSARAGRPSASMEPR